MVGAVTGALTLVTLALLAVPVAERARHLRPPRRWRPPSERHYPQVSRAGGGFEPLRMAASPMRWPSEISHPPSTLVLPPWPSETWTDDPFPRGDRPVSSPVPAGAENRDAGPPPSPAVPEATLQAIVARHGLAAAVEYVREQTGWSFQDAARYVAEALRRHP